MTNTEVSDTRRPPRGLKRALALGAVIALGVIAGGVMIRSHQADAAQNWANGQSVTTVQLIKATGSPASEALTLPGTMAAWNTARLFSRVNGYVKAWYHDIGNHVGAGTPLGLVDTPELDEQMKQARADLASARANAALARTTAARWSDLLSTHSVSQQEADEKNGDLAVKSAAVAAAQANLDRLSAMRGFATVRAPFSGIVTLRNAQIGDLVGPSAGAGQPMFAMDDVSRMRLYVNVPQSYAGQIHSGLSAQLTAPDYPGRTFQARVVGDSGAISTQTGTLQVELIADNPSGLLRPGGYAQVSFDMPGGKGTTSVPSSVLLFRGEGMQVATVDGQSRVHLVPVRIGRDNGSTVEIVSGLEPGRQIINNPPDSLAEGTLVHVGGANG